MTKPKYAILIYALTLFLAACQPAPTPTAQSTPFEIPIDLSILKITATPSITPSPSPSPTPSPPSILRSLNSSLWYLQSGKIYRFDFQAWESEEIPIPADGEIKYAEMSEGMQSIAYIDSEGLKVVSMQNSIEFAFISDNVTMDHSDILLNSDGSLVAFSDEEALKIYDLSTGSTSTLIYHILEDLNNEDLGVGDYRTYTPAQWSANNDWLIVEELY